jgi:hypothetical protein
LGHCRTHRAPVLHPKRLTSFLRLNALQAIVAHLFIFCGYHVQKLIDTNYAVYVNQSIFVCRTKKDIIAYGADDILFEARK